MISVFIDLVLRFSNGLSWHLEKNKKKRKKRKNIEKQTGTAVPNIIHNSQSIN